MQKIYDIRINGTQCTLCGKYKTFNATPRQHSRWQSVRFAGNRYVLKGGIRTDFFINLNSPILKKANK
ncbi:hypothetical protein LCGC14_1774640 [marine sediment metagenome]|uniref:Uncharacterized protein n=1 Tax=marine sediment metagenome TaxID=412755 RepID=A0A0F9HJQ5_9ZZZZ